MSHFIHCFRENAITLSRISFLNVCSFFQKVKTKLLKMNGKVLVHLKHVKKKKEKNGMLVVHLMQVVPMSWSNGGKKADISPHLSLVTVLLSLCLDTDNSFPHLRNTAGRIWQMYFLNLRNTVYGSRHYGFSLCLGLMGRRRLLIFHRIFL